MTLVLIFFYYTKTLLEIPPFDFLEDNSPINEINTFRHVFGKHLQHYKLKNTEQHF